MKKLLVLTFLFQTLISFSQTEKFVNLLNQELKKELKRIEKNPNAEKFEVVQFYQLKDSVIITEEYVEDPQYPRLIMRADLKYLSVVIKKQDSYTGKTYIQRQEVNLGDVEKIVKDINTLFTTYGNAVLVTTTEENGEVESYRTNQFFLHLNQEKNNEHFADKFVDIFNKAGYDKKDEIVRYSIEKGIWAD